LDNNTDHDHEDINNMDTDTENGIVAIVERTPEIVSADRSIDMPLSNGDIMGKVGAVNDALNSIDAGKFSFYKQNPCLYEVNIKTEDEQVIAKESLVTDFETKTTLLFVARTSSNLVKNDTILTVKVANWDMGNHRFVNVLSELFVDFETSQSKWLCFCQQVKRVRIPSFCLSNYLNKLPKPVPTNVIDADKMEKKIYLV